ncbi:MAG: response regulator, partial [Saprospiraceae bacterium]|nr:response regulator [Saprospiraceae bacterium]
DIDDKDAREGAGLGLSISKAYVEMLGRKIWVECEVGLGSTFYFTIPYNNEKAVNIEDNTNKTEFISKQIKKKLKILLAEDEKSAKLHLSIILRNMSKEILHSRNGIETIELSKNNPDIDIILMDIKMPKMDGYEATRQIRKFNNNVKIIAQTAYALKGDKEKAINAGCDDYISKPINKEELLEKIGKLVKK